MSVRYEIEDGTNAVKVFYDESATPSLYQPHWPNGDAWADASEATEWAELYIASVTDEKAPFAPGARGEEGAAKPTPEEIAEMQAKMKQDRGM